MADLSGILARLEAVTTRLEGVAGSGGGSGGGAAAAADSGDVAASVAEYDDLVSEHFSVFMDSANKIGDDVAEVAKLVEVVVKAQRAFLVCASKSKKPSAVDMQVLLKATADGLGAVQKFREDNRKSKNTNHLAACAEAIPAFGWVQVSPKPAPYVGDMLGAGEFYSNRVLKDFKGKDENHVSFARSLVAFLKGLQGFVKKHHTTGLVWNPNGGDAKANMGAAPAAAAAPAGGPPAGGPAPPPPPPVLTAAEINAGGAKPAAAKADASGLMAALSKGADVTKGLKKVDRSQMTHKNPELRASSVVKADAVKPKAAAAPAKKYGASAAAAKPPKFGLEGKKWVVEYQKDNKNIVVEADKTAVSQTLYAYKCEGSVIKVDGKINAITLDGCKKTALVFTELVATIDVVNCQSVQVQVLNKVPTINIDKTDGCQVYLSRSSLNTEIVSAKSSEMNVSRPGATDDDDFIENALPEQFKTVLKDGKFVTESLVHE